MTILKNILGRFLGSKSENDFKLLKPIIEKVLKASSRIESISDDELRSMTAAFKSKINEAICSEQNEIDDLQSALIKDEVLVTGMAPLRVINKFNPPKSFNNQSWQNLGLRKSLQDKSFNGYLKSIRDTSYSVLQKEK